MSFAGGYVGSKLGRRTMAIAGCTLVSISHFMIAYSIKQNNGLQIIAFFISLQCSLQVLVAPLFWNYISECCSDTQFGPVSTAHYINGALIAVTVEFLSKALQPDGLFVLLGCISLSVTLFFFLCLQETRYLTDRQKKELYWPRELTQK